MRARRRVAATFVAIAAVLVVGGGAVLLRNAAGGPGPGTAWLVSDPRPANVAAVANGYVGQCVDGGVTTVCTSKDAVHWSVSPDPAIFSVEGGSRFVGWSIAHGKAGWVAAGSVDPGTWRSVDGVHWSPMDIGVTHLARAHVQALGEGFAMLGEDEDDRTFLLTSADGLTWTRRERPITADYTLLSGAVGVADRQELDQYGSATLYASSDGVTWREITTPDNWGLPTSSIRLASGGYAALLGDGGPGPIITSADGVTWEFASGSQTEAQALTAVGGKAFAITTVPGTRSQVLMESTDAVAWRRVAVLDGDSVPASKLAPVGDYLGLFEGSRLAAVWDPSGRPSLDRSDRKVEWHGGSGDPANSVVGAGWRWTRADFWPDSDIVPLPGGYLARCGLWMCTSVDGLSWRTPPDQQIFRADRTAVFTPLSYAHTPTGAYAILADERVWYAPDGVNWRLADVPVGTYDAVTAGPAGFALFLDTRVSCATLISADGATWSKGPDSPCDEFWPHLQGDLSGGLLMSIAPRQGEPVKSYYSPDGRSWEEVAVPEESRPSGAVWRLADGSLFACSSGPMLRSTDGRTWTALAIGEPGTFDREPRETCGVAEAEGRLIVQGHAVWESTDSGATFHRLVDFAFLWQRGELVVASHHQLGSRGDDFYLYLGTALDPKVLPGSPAAIADLPYARPDLPTSIDGGISRAEALRIAAGRVVVLDPVEDAYVDRTCHSGPGVCWVVSYPASGEISLPFEIDPFTGEWFMPGVW